MKNENNELAMVYGKKEEETRQYQGLLLELEKKLKKA